MKTFGHQASTTGARRLWARLVIAAALLLALPACKEARPDAHIRQALDELRGIDTVSDADFSDPSFGARLDAANSRIDADLQQSRDEAAKEKIRGALALCRQVHNASSAGESGAADEESPAREQVHQAAAFAIEFAAADDVRRKVLAAVEQENQKAAAKLRAERRHLREEAEKARAELKSREMEERNAAQKAVDEIAAEKRQIETKLNTTVAEQRAQIAALNEKQKQALAELERKKAAEEAEHNRRYSPDDTVYNLRPLAALIQDGVTTIPPGTELKITGTNENGLLQLKWGALESEAASTILTHDRDLAAQVAAADARNQMTLQQRLEEQRFQQEMQRQKEDDAAMRARPTPVPVQAGSPTPANPLGNPTLFGR